MGGWSRDLLMVRAPLTHRPLHLLNPNHGREEADHGPLPLQPPPKGPMMGLPQITMTGRLTADPELRFTPNGRALATFTVASNDRVKQGDQWTDGPACFLECTVWAAKAEAAAEHLRKGVLVTVTGRLEQQSWEAPDGAKRSKHAVKVEEVATVVVAVKAAGRGAGWDDQRGGPTGVKSDPWAEQPQAFTPPF